MESDPARRCTLDVGAPRGGGPPDDDNAVRDDWWRLPRRELAAVLHIGLPGAAENIAYRLAFMFSVATAAQLGATSLATQAYVLQLMPK